MPSERFLRLNEEKRKRILEAAYKEFAQHPMEDVSINRIIKDADISRGSFYTYFEDKHDVLMYIMRSHKQQETEDIKAMLKRHDFDPVSMLDELVYYYVREIREQEKGSRINILSNAGLFTSEDIKDLCDDSGDDLADWIWEEMDRTRLNVQQPRVFRAAVVHFRLLTAMTAARIVMYPEKEKETMDIFHELIRVFREGVEKR